ncbi:unnamed protein product [Meloidogyne enterolobii]|uniref:Uncharacterized protein n=1 Tax=Meloidogyne enterolobii TaxID=390850 RepID=A0ACB1AAE7_MELEN
MSNLSFRYFKTPHQTPIKSSLQLRKQQGTSSAIWIEGQILNPQNIIVVSLNAVGAVDA